MSLMRRGLDTGRGERGMCAETWTYAGAVGTGRAVGERMAGGKDAEAAVAVVLAQLFCDDVVAAAVLRAFAVGRQRGPAQTKDGRTCGDDTYWLGHHKPDPRLLSAQTRHAPLSIMSTRSRTGLFLSFRDSRDARYHDDEHIALITAPVVDALPPPWSVPCPTVHRPSHIP